MLKKPGSAAYNNPWLIAILAGSIINVTIFAALGRLGGKEPAATRTQPTKLTIGFVQKNRQVVPVRSRPTRPAPKTAANKSTKKHRQIRHPVAQQTTATTQLPAKPATTTKPVSKEHKQQDLLPKPVPVYQLTGLPHFIHKEKPIYPAHLRQQEKEATVKLELFIDANGQIRSIRILKSAGTDFDQAAINAIRASTFAAGNVNGKAVPVLMRMPVKFKLR